MGVITFFAFYLNLLVVYIIGLFFACTVLLRLLWKLITNPRRFVVETFWKRRDVMPPCLNDPTLGSHGFIHLEDVKLHYVASGDESKPLMLFLHGFLECWYSWRHQIREFNKDFRVVAVDMRGYSDSDKPRGYRNYSLDKLVTDIRQLIPALGYRSAILVTADWGSIIAWKFALQYPEMVDKLISLNFTHPVPLQRFLRSNFKQMMKSWYINFFAIPLIPELYIRAMDFQILNRVLQNMTQGLGMKSKSVTDEDMEAYKYAISRPGAIVGSLNYYRAAMRLGFPDMTGVIHMPVLLIWGLPDLGISKELAPLVGEHADNFTLEYVENSSHFVNIESPKEFNRIMREYLTGTR